MLDMKKMILLLFVSLFVLSFAGMALAQDKVGYVDPQKILASHPKYEAVQKQLDQFAKKKADATKKAVDKENDPKKKSDLYEVARRESGQEELRLMNPIMNEINDAITKVAKSKGITVVLNKTLVFFGGIDLTDDVLKIIKK